MTGPHVHVYLQIKEETIIKSIYISQNFLLKIEMRYLG